MRRLIVMACAAVCLGAGPAAAPPKPGAKPAATAPTRVRDGLVNGALRYLVPPEWEITERGADRMTVFYRHKPERAHYSMQVTQQAQGIPQNDARFKKQMVETILNFANEDLKRRKVEVLDPPTVERDDRFLLRVHERFKEGDTIVDVIHIYRGLGLNLVSLTSSTSSEEANQVKAVHAAGEMVLLSASLANQDPKVVRPVNAKKDECRARARRRRLENDYGRPGTRVDRLLSSVLRYAASVTRRHGRDARDTGRQRAAD
jgi:hypothetical protein